MKRLYFGLVGLLLSMNLCFVFGQKVENVTSVLEGNRIKVNYQLTNPVANQVVKINLYYSLNNGPFIGPLQKVSGDAGDYVSGTGTKAILWDVLSEIGSLEGNTSFKVEVLPQMQAIYQKVSNSQFEAEITSCKIKATQLAIDVNITNLGDDVRLLLRSKHTKNISINDEFGNQYLCNTFIVSQLKIDNDDKYVDFVKDVPVKVTFLFSNVGLDAKEIKLLDIILDKNEYVSTIFSRIQIRDFPILK